MKTNQLMKRRMGNIDVTQRTKDGFFCASELLKQWNEGNNHKKNVNHYLENSKTKEFIKALINGDVESMNAYMNDVALQTFSSFDSGKKESDKRAPENFYHGFVLGLMVDQTENYIITSNRESGYGRYDIMLEPIDKSNEKQPGIVIEFKVINPKKEKTLEETVEAALNQIEDKGYDAELVKRGVKKENIHHYGFAFKGKKVLIG